MKRLVTLMCAAAITAGALSQSAHNVEQNAIDCGVAMWNDRNYQGCADQMDRALRSGVALTDVQAATATFYRAMAAVMTGSSDARSLLDGFLVNFPASEHRQRALMAIGDIDFNTGAYATALEAYNKVNPASFASGERDNLTYRRAYCLLMLGEYDKALEGMDELKSSPAYSNASLFYRGYIAYVKGDYSRAMTLMQGVKQEGDPGRDTPYYIMEMEFARGDFDAALKSARRLLKRSDITPEFRAQCNRVAGESLFNLDRLSEATPFLWNYAAEAASPAPSAYYILGLAEYNENHPDAAIKLLQRVIHANDGLAQNAYLLLGQAYLKRGDSTSAMLAFENAYNLRYDAKVSETALYNYAVAKMEGGSVPFGSSAKLLQQFLREFPDSRYAPQVQEYLIAGYLTDNDYATALEVIDSIKNPSAATINARRRVLFVLATREFAAGQTAKAETHLKDVIAMGGEKTDPLLLQARLWLADCLYSRGDYNGAIADYRAFLAGAPANDANRALAYYGLGYSLFSAGKYSDALTEFRQAIKASKSTDIDLKADSYNRAGDCLYYSSRFNEASSEYRHALDLNPGAGDYALYQLAVVKGLQGDHSGKIATINDLITRFPATGLVPAALLEKAESQVAMGNTTSAIDTYRTLVNGYGTTAPGRNGYLQLAMLYLNGGNRSEAIDTYKRVITIYPTSDEARLAADDLKRIYAADGKLGDYVAFINSIPEAPRMEEGEMERLTYEAAEAAYASSAETTQLMNYVRQYPDGAYRPNALYYLAEQAWNSGNPSQAITYAETLTTAYPHAEIAESALLIKGDAEMDLGKAATALETFRQLEKSASDATMLHNARMGVMRAASALERNNEVIETATTLLGSTASQLQNNDTDETRYLMAAALWRNGDTDAADALWRELAENPARLYGSMSAVALGQALLDRGDAAQAHDVIDNFINANPPHQYWLARGFILYSDILRRQGNTFEADEYLKSLRNNYPGTETDITDMINQRLK